VELFLILDTVHGTTLCNMLRERYAFSFATYSAYFSRGKLNVVAPDVPSLPHFCIDFKNC
jgi:hypothetical protein